MKTGRFRASFETGARTLLRALALPLLAGLVAACATAPGLQKSGPVSISAETVLTQSPLAPRVARPAESGRDILAISPEMVAFLDRHINRSTAKHARLDQLVNAVVEGDQFVLAYDDSTRTASETFADGRGNCLSFTSMFVSMARNLDLSAHFQEVAMPPDWSMSGDTFLLSQHVNAVIDFRNGSTRVVDFNTYEFEAYANGRTISDERARAHFFNNIGAEHILNGNASLAYANIRQSLAEDDSFAPAWINMGILHRREGLAHLAEASFLQALELEHGNLMAMSNLAGLYDEMGDTDRYDYYYEKVRRHRMNNPYYRYQMAYEAYTEGHYEASIDHLKVSIRKRREEDRFYYLLSLNYLMLGDRDAARKSMKKAEELARIDEQKFRYHRKLELIKMRQVGGPAQESKALPTTVE